MPCHIPRPLTLDTQNLHTLLKHVSFWEKYEIESEKNNEIEWSKTKPNTLFYFLIYYFEEEW